MDFINDKVERNTCKIIEVKHQEACTVGRRISREALRKPLFSGESKILKKL